METVESMERLVKKKHFRSFQFTLNNFRWCTKNFQENFICASLTSHRFLNEFPVNNFPGYRPRGLHFQQVHVARSYIWENKITLPNRLRCLRKFCENFSKNAFPARIFCRFLEQMLFLPSTGSKRRKKNVVDNRYREKKEKFISWKPMWVEDVSSTFFFARRKRNFCRFPFSIFRNREVLS